MWQIASSTGWKPHYILWRVSYALLMTMTADAPRYVSEEETTPIQAKPKSTVEIFQQMISKNNETGRN